MSLRTQIVLVHLATAAALLLLATALLDVAADAIDASNARGAPTCSDAAHSVARCR